MPHAKKRTGPSIGKPAGGFLLLHNAHPQVQPRSQQVHAAAPKVVKDLLAKINRMSLLARTPTRLHHPSLVTPPPREPFFRLADYDSTIKADIPRYMECIHPRLLRAYLEALDFNHHATRSTTDALVLLLQYIPAPQNPIHRFRPLHIGLVSIEEKIILEGGPWADASARLRASDAVFTRQGHRGCVLIALRVTGPPLYGDDPDRPTHEEPLTHCQSFVLPEEDVMAVEANASWDHEMIRFLCEFRG